MIERRKYAYLAIDLRELNVNGFRTGESLALFLWGRDVRDYLIVKDESRVVNLTTCDVIEIGKALDEA